ncbi:MAG: HpcH/HpaI aldolase/citrate lyase family protein [Anaerolineae bacterium]
MHPRRALLYVPGEDRHKIEKSLTFGADCLCLDMEDGVAPSRKADARHNIALALRALDFGASEKLARLNAPGSGLEQDDLDAVLPAHPDGIVLPKVETPEQVQWAAASIEAAELEHGWAVNSVRLLVGIESPRAILALKDIASHPRLDALIFGGEDYAAAVGATRTPEALEIFTPRSLVLMHARAFGLQAIDMVCIDYRDLETLRREAEVGAQLGFDGKQVIHPDQVPPVHQAFTPSDNAIARARELVAAYEAHQQEGRGAFGVDGKMIDLPLVKAARNVLDRARAAGSV